MALAGDHAQLLVGGYDLTGDSNRITISDVRRMHDVTAFGDGVHKSIAGQQVSVLTHMGYFNPVAAKSHPVLKSGTVAGIVSVILGQNAAPVVGDLAYCMDSIQSRYAAMPETSRYVPFVTGFANRGDLGGWGVALTPPLSFTNTTTGSGVNNGAASSNGGAAFLHVLQAAASDTYTIIVQGATNSGFTTGLVTLATFTLNASALGSERIPISGSIPQYTRFKATRSGAAGNTVKMAVSLVRF
jgi:hypothetical protein